jgi:peptide-methionine (R)-S-oxide reductase
MEDAMTESGKAKDKVEKLQRSDEEWKKLLTPAQYQVMRQHGTERAFTHPYYESTGEGLFVCAACGQELFDANDKYDSGSGWPSFTRPADPVDVATDTDTSHGMVRSEVRCARCDSHLGHVFPDGPQPTGMRYCINGVALKKIAKEKSTD